MTSSVSQITMPAPSYHNIEGGLSTSASQDIGEPPSYEEAINPNGNVTFDLRPGTTTECLKRFSAPPPSYDSLFGRVREARRTSKGVFDFFKNILIILLGAGKLIRYSASIPDLLFIPNYSWLYSYFGCYDYNTDMYDSYGSYIFA